MIKIEIADTSDAQFLPDIERSSGEAFRPLPSLAWIADDDVQSLERHLELIELGQAWVARSDQGIVGFLSAERFVNSLHIWQMAVHSDFQKKGIGRALSDEAKQAAASAGLTNLTLTTFRHVAWNEPFYASCGFRTLKPNDLCERLKATLDAEERAGLPLDQRCAMSCSILEREPV